MTLDGIIAAIYLIVAFFSLLLAGTVGLVTRAWTPDPAEFSKTIEKLIWSNNIDRAIKLCNSIDAPAKRMGFSRAFKAMLVMANKVENLDSTLHHAFLEEFPFGLKKDWEARSRFTTVLNFLSAILFSLPLLFVMQDAFAMKLAAISMVVIHLSYASVRNAAYRVLIYGSAVWPHLLRVRSLLYIRARFADPLVGDLKPLTPEEHADLVQRMAMSEIGADYRC